MDVEHLKSRTVAALGRLGRQRFSPEPGGYTLADWMKGVELLLDDFEAKMGTGRLTSEYAEKRRELEGFLSRPVDLSPVQDEMARVRKEGDEAMKRLEDAKSLTTFEVNRLHSELDALSVELVVKKRALDEVEERQSKSLFRRFLGADSSKSEEAAEVGEIESQIRSLTGELSEQRKSLKSLEMHPLQSKWADDWRKVQSSRSKLGELEDEKLNRLQVSKERQELTASLADAIARLPVS